MEYSRRRFIQALAGLGLLPLVNVPKLLAATTTPPLRFLFVSLQHGWGMGSSLPDNIGNFSGTADNFNLPDIWTPFEAIKNQCLFIDGLRGGIFAHKVNAHDHSYSDILTAGTALDPTKSGGNFPYPVNPSIDWQIAQHYGKDALLFSRGYASWGQPFHPLSYDSGLNRLPFFTDAGQAYNSIKSQIEGGSGTPLPDLVSPRLFSILENRSQMLLGKLNGYEKQKIEKYEAAAQAMNAKITQSGGQVIAGTARVEKVPVAGQSQNAEMDSYLDMIRVAFTNNSHQVAVLGLGNWDNGYERSQIIQESTEGFHHAVAHYGEGNTHAADSRAAMKNWTHWHINKIVGLVQRLETTLDIDGSPLIDNTVIVLTGEVGNGVHATRAKGHILIGGGNRISKGKWLKLPGVEPRNRQGFQLFTRDAAGTLVENTVNYGSQYSQYTHGDLFVQLGNLAGLGISSFGMDVHNAAYNSIAPLNLKI